MQILLFIIVNHFYGFISGGTGAASKLAAGKVAATPQRVRWQPETDPVKLTTHLCGADISREGGKDPELKPESEYPDWLWTLRTERGCPPIEELDPDSWAYWRRLHKENTHRHQSIWRDKYKYRRF